MKYLFVFVISIIGGGSFAQHWAWVNHLTGGGGSHYTIDSTIGNDSNSVYFCGRYRATATFYGQDGTDIVNPPFGGSRDIFLAKTDTAGHLLWVKTIGGSDTEYGFSVTVDEFDNVYLTGQFYTGCNFQGTPITSIGSADVYVAKFDTDGNFIWVKTIGGVGQDTGTKIVCDKMGYIYVGGTQSGNFYFNTDSLEFPGYFVMKMDYVGNIIWAKGPENMTAALSNLYGLKFYKNKLYIGGKYNGTIKLDAITLVSNGAWSDLFFAKMDTSGLTQWAYDAGSTTYDLCNDIAVTDSFIYVVGAYSGTINFDTITRTCNQSVAGSTGALNSRDGFIAKYDSTGTCYWVVEHKSLMAEEEYSVYIGQNGNLFLSGSYLQSADITVSTSVGELRVSEYTQGGDSLWSIASVGAHTGLSHTVCEDVYGNIYFSGAVKDVHTFENTTIPGALTVYSGIMAKIIPPLNTVSSQTLQSCSIDTVIYNLNAQGGPLSYDWYYGAQTLISNSDDSLVLLFDPMITDSVSCVVSNGIDFDTLVFNTPVFNFPLVDLGTDVSTCDTFLILNAGNDGEFYDWGTGSVQYDSTLYVENTGMYYVSVVNSDQCTTIDSVSVLFNDCTFLDDLNSLFSLTITEEILYISTDLQNYNIRIYSIDGKEITNQTALNYSQQISISNLSNGIYLFHIFSTDQKKIEVVKFYK